MFTAIPDEEFTASVPLLVLRVVTNMATLEEHPASPSARHNTATHCAIE
jgi:hypothetical protein